MGAFASAEAARFVAVVTTGFVRTRLAVGMGVSATEGEARVVVELAGIEADDCGGGFCGVPGGWK